MQAVYISCAMFFGGFISALIVALLTLLVTEQQDAAAAFTRRAQALQRYAKRRPLSPPGCCAEVLRCELKCCAELAG